MPILKFYFLIDFDDVLERPLTLVPKMKTAEFLWKLGFDLCIYERQVRAFPGSSKGSVSLSQSPLFPERLEDGIAEDHSGYLIDLFAEDLDLVEVGFRRIVAAEMGRSGCASVGFGIEFNRHQMFTHKRRKRKL